MNTNLFAEIRDLILTARQNIARGVDLLQVMTNFEIGRQIVEYEQAGSARAEYGKQALKELSEKLITEFGAGFSARNLRNMRKFYLVYQERMEQIWQTLSAKSSVVPPSDPHFTRIEHTEFIQQIAACKGILLFV